MANWSIFNNILLHVDDQLTFMRYQRYLMLNYYFISTEIALLNTAKGFVVFETELSQLKKYISFFFQTIFLNS